MKKFYFYSLILISHDFFCEGIRLKYFEFYLLNNF